MDKQVSILITNPKDITKTLTALELGITSLLEYYEKESFVNLFTFVTSLAVWFGKLLIHYKINPEDIK